MKILVISLPVWVNENNSGNTLTNIFSGFDGEFANIYFSGGIPNNEICKKYFQVTDYMVLNKLLKNKTIGKSFILDTKSNTKQKDENFENGAKKYKGIFATLLRELAWKIVKVDNKAMYEFIDEFSPDIVYAPSYGSLRMQRIVRNIKNKTSLPLVSLISDDLYSYKDEMNLLEKIYQYFLRRSMHKTFKLYGKVYTMTVQQQEEYQKIFDCKIDILRKSSLITYRKHQKNKQISLIYAGGVYEGRENTLITLVEAIKNAGLDWRLNIYTNSKVNNEAYFEANSDIVEVYKAIPYQELIEKYYEHDVALHVESFEKKFIERTKLSFSTKIIDCLQSGSVVLAICPKENAGFSFLKEENGAICIDDVNKIKDAFVEIENNYERWQDNAYNCLNKNLRKDVNLQKIYRDFEEVLEKYKG
ncbi:MAG: hypothetical protein MR210_03495 [Erysipelotrichaceae bacterium]|nr:hypothetical protein [Erysipelotrichaceae bacterium]